MKENSLLEIVNHTIHVFFPNFTKKNTESLMLQFLLIVAARSCPFV